MRFTPDARAGMEYKCKVEGHMLEGELMTASSKGLKMVGFGDMQARQGAYVLQTAGWLSQALFWCKLQAVALRHQQDRSLQNYCFL